MNAPLLAHHLVTADGATPDRWMLVLHGVFGMGTNFRSLARQLTARAPGWGFVLVDLRGHGASQGFPPPHHLDAAADDLDRLVDHLDRPVHGVLGHSFGGKVTLAWLERRPGLVARAFVLDSMPGARPEGAEIESAAQVLSVLESMPAELSSREDFGERLAARGYERGIIDWLTMNVRRRGDAFALRLDLPSIRAMLLDYYARDLWHVVDDPRSAELLTLVVAGRSTVFDAAARERARVAASRNAHLDVVELPRAGHWLHVDDPDGVLEVIARRL